MIELTESDLKRLWAKIDKRGPDACWLWTAAMATSVPRLYLAGKAVSALRIMWELHHKRELSAGLNVLRSCKDSRCVNPRHFVTVKKGTRASQIGRRRTWRRRPGMRELADRAGFDLESLGGGRYRVVWGGRSQPCEGAEPSQGVRVGGGE